MVLVSQNNKADCFVNKKKKLNDFKKYEVNKYLMKHANKNAIFLHFLPASRGHEVTGDIIDGKQSVVWHQAVNRCHLQKSILLYCFDKI